METCPRCLFSFYPTKASNKPKPIDEPSVYSHECVTGFIRPYPQKLCFNCPKDMDETVLLPLSRITEINREKKLAQFREQDEEDLPGNILLTEMGASVD